jgi:hypothetical protein
VSGGRDGERGAVAVAVAIFMSGLFGFFALAMSIGTMMDTATELQAASDAAALAAAMSLDGTAAGLAAARTAALGYSQKHTVYRDQVEINSDGDDVSFGRWTCPFGSGSTCFMPEGDPRKITAVMIKNGRDDGYKHNTSLPLAFGAFVGASTAKLGSVAVAVGAGPSSVDCALPLVIGESRIVDSSNNVRCGPGQTQTFTFTNANVDGIGFVNLTPGDNNEPNGTRVSGEIADGCKKGDTSEVGGGFKMQNGDDFGKVADALAGNSKKTGASNTCLIGTTQTFAVSDAGGPNPIFQGSQAVVGFVKATIVAVTDNKGASLSCVPGVQGAAVGSKNAMVLSFPCTAPDTDVGTYGGGRAYNSTNVSVRLVQ